MARVDYYNIEENIAAVFRADASLSGVIVSVEMDIELGTPAFIGIAIDRREAPVERQSLAAGTRTVFLVYFDIICRTFSLDNIARAIQDRDDLLGKVEIVLQNNRTLGGTVSSSWLEGGAMPSGQRPDGPGFVSEGHISLVAETRAIS